jgi:hypothetical protein
MANLPATLEPTTWKPIKVTFSPLVNGKVESIFKINTSVGVFKYTLKGEGYGDTDPGGDTGGTGTTAGSKIPKATLLASEFYNNQDLDANGKIYGYDFKIKDDDSKPSKKPIILCIVEKSPYWTNPTTEISWEEFSA